MADLADDDIPTLSADVLALVNECRREQEERERAAVGGQQMPEEDWQVYRGRRGGGYGIRLR